MLQKSGKNDTADSEFCEGRRKISVNKGNNLFFVGSCVPNEIRQDIRRIDKRLSVCPLTYANAVATRQDNVYNKNDCYPIWCD